MEKIKLKRCIPVLLLASILVGCGGGGGGSVSQAATSAINWPEVLEFDSPASFINRNAHETAETELEIKGSINQSYNPQAPCSVTGSRFVSVLQITWLNERNGQNGGNDIFSRCVETGLIFGRIHQSFWVTEFFPLEPGVNTITFNVFDNGAQIGRNSITIIQKSNPVPDAGNSETDADLPPALLSDQVITPQGTLQGVIEGSLSVFRGVRYAAAPVGDLRFKAPQRSPTFTGVVNAKEFSPVCIQPSGVGSTGEEDCLFLNIWAHNDDVMRPVIVFLHGGGANGVGGNMSSIEGSSLAENGDVIVVTLNRRLGVMGFLALDELIQENPRLTAGNYGVLDVIMALQWIQENIATFNGNPDLVMVAGESSGAVALCHIIAAPEAAGLFQSIALQSGGCGRRMILNDGVGEVSRYEPSIDLHRPILSEVNCESAADVVACLRNIPATQLVNAAAQVPLAGGVLNSFAPTIDGVVVQSNPHDALKNEVVGSIPVIVGSNQDELGNILGNTSVPDDAAYRTILNDTFHSPLDDQLYSIYATANFSSAKIAYLTLIGDILFNCEAEELARSAAGGSPSYLYLLTRGFDQGSLAGSGAVHAIDVPYLFETFAVFGYTPDTRALEISAAMQGAWSALAAQPNTPPPFLGQSASSWPMFVGSIVLVEFGDPITGVTSHRQGRCTGLRNLLTL